MGANLREQLTSDACLPVDPARALLIGRVWLPDVQGPALLRVDGDDLLDLSPIAPTASELLNHPQVAREIRAASSLRRVASLARALANAAVDDRDETAARLL